MPIKTYKESNPGVKITENFTAGEFMCKGKNCCSESEIDTDLADKLQALRTAIGKPIKINSGYRCKTHNASPTVKGAKGSKHTYGMAADIVCPGVTPLELARCAEAIGFKCVILYTTKNFVHVDTRTNKYIATDNSKGTIKSLATHGKPTLIKVKSTYPIPTKTLLLGLNGNEVKWVQEKLSALGFKDAKGNALKVDGDFGKKTDEAVRSFQKAKKLEVDGKVGKLTREALDK